MTRAPILGAPAFGLAVPPSYRGETSAATGAPARPVPTLTEGALILRRHVLVLAALVVCAVALAWARAAAASHVTVEQAVCLVFRDRCAQALRVARCESNLDPRAVSRTQDVGLFQINWRAHRRPGEPFQAFRARYVDIATNLRYAYRLSNGGRDWHTHWYMSRRCWR